MTMQDLQTLIQQGEGYNLEFKQSIPSKLSELARELCAFANASGGTILVGVSDHGLITGINSSNPVRSEIQQAVNLLEPQLDVQVSEFKLDDKTILSLKCKQGPDRPYMVSGSVYIRNGPNSEKMLSRDRIWDFWEHMGKIFFDRKRCRHFKYPEDFDSEAFKAFLQKAGITASLEEKKLLTNLGLISNDGYFRYAAIMMLQKMFSITCRMQQLHAFF